MSDQIVSNNLDKMHRLAGPSSINLGIGLMLVVSACLHGSFPWAFYCVLTGWIGVVLESSGGTLWAYQLLGRAPKHHQLSKSQLMFISILTFWIPTLAVAAFGLGMVGALPEGLQPTNYAQSGFRVLMESFTMFFLTAGASLRAVTSEARVFRQESSATSKQTHYQEPPV